ncbi:unnamed protein product [Discosporangium mesarthrocarpum]
MHIGEALVILLLRPRFLSHLDNIRGIQELGSWTQVGPNCGKGKHGCVLGRCGIRIGKKRANLWGFLDYVRDLKLLQNPVGDLYLVGGLFTNIHTCKHDSQVGESYREIPPSMETYFKLHGHSSD